MTKPQSLYNIGNLFLDPNDDAKGIVYDMFLKNNIYDKKIWIYKIHWCNVDSWNHEGGLDTEETETSLKDMVFLSS